MITKENLLKIKRDKNLTILSHYYTSPIIQDVSDFVGDSLALAQYAYSHNLKNIVLCGVSFMAEVIKILLPNSNVYVPVEYSPCSLANSCDVKSILSLKNKYPNSILVTYVNSSIDVKMISDIIITSSNAIKIIDSIDIDKDIIVCPDYNLGSYIKEKVQRNLILYNGACHVHNMFDEEDLKLNINLHPNALVLGHPELPPNMRNYCNFIGSTKQILDYPSFSSSDEYIILTEYGISHQLQLSYPNYKFYFVKSILGNQNICKSMKLINANNLYDCMSNNKYIVNICDEYLALAKKPIVKMLKLS